MKKKVIAFTALSLFSVTSFAESYKVANDGIESSSTNYIPWNYYKGHRIISNPLSKNQVSNVTVGIEFLADIPSEWITATQNAITRLNSASSSAGSSVRFSWTGSNSGTVKIDYCSCNMDGNTYAQAPTGGVDNGFTFLQINNNFHSSTTSSEREGVIMHELLHTIGFSHSGSSSFTEIAGTDSYWDCVYAGTSLMRAGHPDGPPNYLTFLDKRALATVYPK